MARPVDDILADLLALEEETLGVSDAAAGAASAQAWDPGADALLLADPAASTTTAAVTNAADAALLADCDALLADVDLLLSDTAGPAAAAPQPARTTRPAQAAATAAVLSECDALLADADLLLADIPDDHSSAGDAAPAVPAPAASRQVAAVDAPAPAAAAAVAHEEAVQASAGAAQAAGLASPQPRASPADQPTPPAPSAGPGVAVAAPSSTLRGGATGAPQQQADVDDLLSSLLSPPGDAAPAVTTDPAAQPGFGDAANVAEATAAAVFSQQQLQQPGQLQPTSQQPEQLPVVQQQLQQQQGLGHQQDISQQQQLAAQQLDPITAASHQQQHQQPEHLEGLVLQGAASSSSSDDDLLGDMLHDMAEVLEVDEGSLGAQAAADMQLPQAAAAAASVSAVANTAAAAAAGGGFGFSGGSSGSSDQEQHSSAGAWQQGLPSTAGLSGTLSSASGFEAVLWQPAAATVGAAASSGQLPPHEAALQQAWVQEEALVHGGLSTSPPGSPTAAAGEAQQASSEDAHVQQQLRKRRRLAPLPRLQELLSDALADWNPAGRPDASGTAMIGGSVLLCLESLAGLFAAGAAAAGAASGVNWAQVLSSALAPHGQLQSVAASGQYLAVGAASGSTLVFQLPVAQAPAAQGQAPPHPTHSTGSGHSPLPGGAAMWQLGAVAGSERGGLGFDPVCSLGFSTVGTPGDALWLAVGHVSGALTVWELQKRGPRQIAGIAQHSSRLTFTTFMPGRSTSLLLSGDVRGRCCLHRFSASLLRTNVASRVLIAGEYGPLLSIAHLAPFSMRPAAVPAAAVKGAGGSGAAEWPDVAAWKMLCEEGAWRVGEGVCCLTTPSHTYIARVKPLSGDLVMLFSIPQPDPGAQQGAVPVAAWLPHNRQKAGGVSRVSGDTLMPLGVLALGWGSRLVLFEVPMVGDQITAGEAAAVAVTASQAAAAAHQAKRTQQPAAVAAAAASRLWQQRSHAALDSLTPEVAIAVATQFPLSTCASWEGGQQQQQQPQGSAGCAAGLDLQQHQLLMGPAEPLPILGVHWLDADACAVVCNQGYSSLLVVLGLTGAAGSSSTDPGHDKQQHQQQRQQQQPAALRVYEQVEWMDQPVDRGWGSAGGGAGGLLAWGADCGGAVVGSGARMYLLGQQGGLFCGRLMPWSERLKTLQDVRKYKLGLYFALRFYLAMKHQQQQEGEEEGHGASAAALRQQPPLRSKSSSSSGGPPALTPRQSVGGFARSEGQGAEPQQLEQWLLSLVLGHAAATLTDTAATATVESARNASPNGGLHPGSGVPAAVVQAAEACVCACLLLARTDVLFGRVFQLFAQQGSVPGALGALVETIELAVLSDLLQGLAPEVMQALVEHYAALGQPGRVEACVVHLPILSMDLNQVIRLCEGSGLYSALTHIYNQMNDFRKPLLDLLANVAAAPSWAAAQAAAYKLLVYLRCCFRGMAFPPGTGSLPTEPVGMRDVIQATLLGSLLFLDRADLLREWQQAGGPAAAVAAAVLAKGGQGAAGGPVLSALCDPHPALQLLLAVDVPATITVLAEATAGWDAVETDLRTAAGKPTTELESVLVATQVVVNALVTLLEAGRFQQWQAHRPAHTSTGGSGSSSSGGAGAQPGADVAMSYITQLLAAGRVNAKPSFVIRLLQHLVAQATAAVAQAEQQQQQHRPAAGPSAAAAAAAPFEQQFMSIVQVVGVQVTTSASAGSAGGVAQQQPGQALPGDSCAFSPVQAKEVLLLAKRCNFLRAAATVHHLQHNFAAALSCYLALVDQQRSQHLQQQQVEPDQQQQEGQQQRALAAGATGGSLAQQESRAVFDYINGFLSGGGSSADARSAFLACVRQQVVQLIRLDAGATAAVLLQHMPEQQVPVLLSLAADPELQFQFLRAAMQQNQQAQRQSGTGAGPAGAAAAAAAGGVESLLERPEVALLYVKLLARFEPSAVLPFLQSHHNYSVAEAIKVCRAAGVADAEAFLHERLGDLDAALRLYLRSTQQANSSLQAALLAGSVPLLLLPPGYWVPGWFDRSNTVRASSSREQACWGMDQLVAQLDSVAQMVTGAPASSRQQEAAVPGDIHQASEQLLAAAANVAATLLHQLDPALTVSSSGSTTKRLDAAPAAAGDSLCGGTADDNSTASGAQQLPPPTTDLYKSWMAELSPRLRLKGLGAGVGITAAALGPKHAVQPLSSCASSSTAGAMQAGPRMPAVPSELAVAWQAVQAAVAFCQRNTRASGSAAPGTSAAAASSSSAPAGAGQELWFQLMDVFVDSLRALHALQQQQQQADAAHHQQQLVADLLRAARQQVPLQELPSKLAAAAAAVASQHVLPGLLRLLLDEVVGCMADHLPLLDIVGRIIRQHGSERFGEFRSTLLGLFGATGYDSAIMAAANRLITGDAFTAVRHAYGLRQLARSIQEQQRQQQQQQGEQQQQPGEHHAQASSSMVVAPPSAAAAAAPVAAVQSAMLLGVLGGASSYEQASRVGGVGSRYSLTQADRDLIQGILGSGGMKLRLRPAGPLAGQLPGVAGAYRAAAQAAADTGRVFTGEMDLALELAMLQSLHEHQQHQQRRHQQQQHGGAAAHGGEEWGGGRSEGPAQEGSGDAAAGRVAASTSSFDIDDLLNWSAANM